MSLAPSDRLLTQTTDPLTTIRRCVDRHGLLTTDMGNALRPGQELFVRDADEVKDWKRSEGDKGIELLEVVKQAKPTMLIGCSTMSGAFSEEIVKEMAKHVARPVIFPLSNPTRLAEADPSELLLLSLNRDES